MSYTCWCKWTVRTEERFEKHLQMHIKHGDYDIPLFNGGTKRPHPWTFQNTKGMVFWRDMGICRCCGIKANEYEIHHIKSRYQGGSDHPQNLILLCVNCHNLTKSAQNGYGGVPNYCILPARKHLLEGQRTIDAYISITNV